MKKLTMLFALILFSAILRAQTTHIGVDSTHGCAPFGLTFTNLDTTGGNWTWYFEGGTPSSSSLPVQEVLYDNPGHFLVELSNGDSSMTEQLWIDVFLPEIETFSQQINGNIVSFHQNNYALNYHWDFGDGTTSQEKNPTHTYDFTGVYYVSLSYTTICGEFYTASQIFIDSVLTPHILPANASGCAPFSVDFEQANIDNPNDWTWYFEGGDPSTSTDSFPSVTFNQPGNYSAYLVSTSGDTLTSHIIVNTNPIIDFVATISGTDVSFVADSLPYHQYQWDFGDGSSQITDSLVNHRYSAAGTYTVTLTYLSFCGYSTITKDITITDGIAVDATEGCAPLTLTFTNVNTQNAGWSWIFPGGTPATSTAASQEVTFANPGTYQVTLSDANSNIIQQLEIVATSGTNDGFSTQVTDNTVQFTNLNSPAPNTLYIWDFGDGTNSTEPNPTHVYYNIGNFVVTLAKSTLCGEFSVMDTVTINYVDSPIIPIDTTITQFVRNMVTGNKQGVTNVTGQFTPMSIGTFEDFAPNAIDLDKGVILSTGNILDAIGPNITGNKSTHLEIPGDSTLQNYTTGNTFDATFIEFDFVPSTNVINFSYVFASEEYPEYVGSPYNDVFGFFISGPGIVGEQNIAFLPGLDIPVTINNVNDQTNSSFYKSNVSPNPIAHQDLQYDGLTIPLVAEAVVLPTETYHIKMGVADVGDDIFDSAVFLKANSFQSKPLVFNFDFTEGNYEEVLYEDSSSLKISATLPHPAQQDFTYHFSYTGDAQVGSDYIAPQSFTFPAGETTASFKIKALADDAVEDDETIQLVIQETQDTITITIKDQTVVGHHAPESINTISFTPNPAHDVFALPAGLKAESVEIFSLAGKRVRLYLTGFDHMDISNLPSGMYSVSVHAVDGNWVGKLRIE